MNRVTKLRKLIENMLERFFPQGSVFKALVLKVFLRNKEKQLFTLIAPKDAVRTNSLDGYLYTNGWWDAIGKYWFKNSDGQYMPWFTYPATAFINSLDKTQLSVLEFGGGSSTLFWAKNVNNVTTIEHEESWYKELHSKVPKNVNLLYVPLEPIHNYTQPINTKEQFDIIVVDGRERVKVCQAILPYLSENGVVILDDSERARYQEGISFLKEHGFKELPFWGLRSQGILSSRTSIFYREQNCFNI